MRKENSGVKRSQNAKHFSISKNFKNKFKTNKSFSFEIKRDDPVEALNEIRPEIINKINETFQVPLKFNIVLIGDLKKPKTDDNGEAFSEYVTHYANSSTQQVLNSSDLLEALDKSFEQIYRSIERFTNCGSGFSYVETKIIYLNIYQVEHFKAAKWFPLPPTIARKKHVLIHRI